MRYEQICVPVLAFFVFERLSKTLIIYAFNSLNKENFQNPKSIKLQ